MEFTNARVNSELLTGVTGIFGVIGLLIICAAIAGTVPGLFHEPSTEHIPPESVETLDDFFEWSPIVRGYYKIEVGGSVYYCAEGEGPGASGEPVYVFDSNGNFVAWAEDWGEGIHPTIIHNHFADRISIGATELPAVGRRGDGE